ncbi:hypothetical protein LO763_13340 [Glycomyces sp. A-F 0318]|uniref:hypothetical protein n=1 Tax=Glycomyces amatae TaxID=2881355 RepID=UPI001E4E391D|nr:hypothetical protein [Glycomyces amatae]MCD0444606.1 hypothetical protein [Glycomyces amatae]
MNLLRRLLLALAAMAALTAPAVFAGAPAHAAWGAQYPVTIQVTGNGHQLGYATGWVQFDTGGDTFQYSITVCRQSSYTPPSLRVAVNAYTPGNLYGTTVTTHYTDPTGPSGTAPCYGRSQTVTGQHTFTGHQNVYFVLSGNTFVNGNNFTVYTQDRYVSNPY